MSLPLNLVRQNSATVGTGTLTLGSAVSGFIDIVSAGGVDGQTYPYAIEGTYVGGIATAREVGLGVLGGGGTTLTRSVLKSTNSNALVSFTGDEQVIITLLAESIRELLTTATTYYVRANLGTVTLSIASPAVATLNNHGLSANDPVVFSIPPDRLISTVTIASPAVVTKTAHGFAAGDPVIFSTTGALPTGITAGTTYFVIATGLTTDTFRFSTTVGGAAVNTSGTQSGVHIAERGGALPTGVTAGTIYYVISTGLTANSFQFSTSQGGAAVNTSGTQSGVFDLATGNDNNNGLAATRSGAWLTFIGGPATQLPRKDLGGRNVTIQFADSVYTSSVAVPNLLGCGYLIIVGNTLYPSNVLFDITGTHGFYAFGNYPYTVEGGGFSVKSSNQQGIYWAPVAGTFLVTSGIDILACGGAAQITTAGQLQLLARIFILADCAIHAQSTGVTGNMIYYPGQVYLFGTRAFSAELVKANNLAYFEAAGGTTFNGTQTGKRYTVDTNAIMYTLSGASYFPGTVAGDQTNGGLYL